MKKKQEDQLKRKLLKTYFFVNNWFYKIMQMGPPNLVTNTSMLNEINYLTISNHNLSQMINLKNINITKAKNQTHWVYYKLETLKRNLKILWIDWRYIKNGNTLLGGETRTSRWHDGGKQKPKGKHKESLLRNVKSSADSKLKIVHGKKKNEN